MGGVSLSKESCRFVKEERSLSIRLVKRASCNQTKLKQEVIKLTLRKKGNYLD